MEKDAAHLFACSVRYAAVPYTCIPQEDGLWSLCSGFNPRTVIRTNMTDLDLLTHLRNSFKTAYDRAQKEQEKLKHDMNPLGDLDDLDIDLDF